MKNRWEIGIICELSRQKSYILKDKKMICLVSLDSNMQESGIQIISLAQQCVKAERKAGPWADSGLDFKAYS